MRKKYFNVLVGTPCQNDGRLTKAQIVGLACRLWPLDGERLERFKRKKVAAMVLIINKHTKDASYRECLLRGLKQQRLLRLSNKKTCYLTQLGKALQKKGE